MTGLLVAGCGGTETGNQPAGTGTGKSPGSESPEFPESGNMTHEIIKIGIQLRLYIESSPARAAGDERKMNIHPEAVQRGI